MEFSAADLSTGARYKLVMGSVVPRPVAWVTTKSTAGIVNCAPFSAFTVCAADPAILMFQSARRRGEEKDTARNIRETGEFVVNIGNQSLVQHMHNSSARLPPERGEPAEFDIPLADSRVIAPPRIASAPVSFECKLERMLDIGNQKNQVIFGVVHHIHVADALYQDGRIDQKALAPIARLGGPNYATLGEFFQMAVPQGYTSDV